MVLGGRWDGGNLMVGRGRPDVPLYSERASEPPTVTFGGTFAVFGHRKTRVIKQWALKSGEPVGQWTNEQKARRWLAEQHTNLLQTSASGTTFLPLPEGVARIVRPDGTTFPATQVRLIWSEEGFLSARPGGPELKRTARGGAGEAASP